MITERGSYVIAQVLCPSRDRAPHRTCLRDLLVVEHVGVVLVVPDPEGFQLFAAAL